jgi:hypothetical protein
VNIRHFAVIVLCILLFGACDAASPGRTPNVTPRPSTRATPTGGSATERPTPTNIQSAPPWTADWQAAFCEGFSEVVIAQQVARDIGRSIEADDRRNAIGLAHELQRTVSELDTALGGLPSWTGATDLVSAVNTMLEQDASLATYYLRYLEEDRTAARDRAQQVERTLREEAIPAVVAAVAPLVELGLSCPDTPLELESP